MVVWGDVAYKKDMFFSPDYWRRYFKPGVKAIVDVCHSHGLPVIYHGCGNARKIFDDLIEAGIDAYNPLEAKAGLDVVELKREFGSRLAWCGNMDVRVWASAPPEELEREVRRKAAAGVDGGYIFQSDHSVTPEISAERYEAAVRWAREARA
jgi:uroporphyrinogen-III decarboxylase